MIQNNILEVWLIIGIICIIADIYSLTIILLFAGLSALTVGCSLYFGLVLENNIYAQMAIFFAACFLWGISLWIPVKKFKKSIFTNKYNNIIGCDAIIDSDIAKYGQEIKVKWSGTIMNAALEKNDNIELKKGDLVTITAINGNKLSIIPKSNK